MKDYIVYLSTGETLETPEAHDSKTLYEAVKYRMRELKDESYYKAAFGIHSNWYPWQLGAVCYIKKENGDLVFVWAMHGDVFFGYDFFVKNTETVKTILRDTFGKDFYKNYKAALDKIII